MEHNRVVEFVFGDMPNSREGNSGNDFQTPKQKKPKYKNSKIHLVFVTNRSESFFYKVSCPKIVGSTPIFTFIKG